MGDHGFEQVIVQLCANDDRYAPAAYYFVREALDLTVTQTGREGKPPGARHVSGGELCEGLRQYAIQQYGPLARSVLAQWGVTSTGDFGNLVFNLIEARLLGKSEEDSLEDFQNVFAFDDAFSEPYRAKQPWAPERPPTL